MKQVVKTNQKQTVDISEVSISKIYAFRSDADSVYVVQQRRGAGFDFYRLDSPSCYHFAAHSSLNACVEACIAMGANVYEFDNLKEFAEWLVKETK